MSEFVEACRREWRRLRVPDAVANEMAADLEADLKEAEAEGATPEDVLGSSAFDARSFAASWAAERGVIGPVAVRVEHAPVRSRVLAALAVSAVVAVAGIVLALAAAPDGSTRMALARPGVVFARPFRPARAKVIRPAEKIGALPRLRFGAVPVPVPRPFIVNVSSGGDDLRTIGVILLVVGVGGLVLTLVYWSPWGGRVRYQPL